MGGGGGGGGGRGGKGKKKGRGGGAAPPALRSAAAAHAPAPAPAHSVRFCDVPIDTVPGLAAGGREWGAVCRRGLAWALHLFCLLSPSPAPRLQPAPLRTARAIMRRPSRATATPSSASRLMRGRAPSRCASHPAPPLPLSCLLSLRPPAQLGILNQQMARSAAPAPAPTPVPYGGGVDDDEEDPSMPASGSGAGGAGPRGGSGAPAPGSGIPSASGAPSVAALEPLDWARPSVAREIPALHGNTISLGLLHAARALALERQGGAFHVRGAPAHLCPPIVEPHPPPLRSWRRRWRLVRQVCWRSRAACPPWCARRACT